MAKEHLIRDTVAGEQDLSETCKHGTDPYLHVQKWDNQNFTDFKRQEEKVWNLNPVVEMYISLDLKKCSANSLVCSK